MVRVGAVGVTGVEDGDQAGVPQRGEQAYLGIDPSAITCAGLEANTLTATERCSSWSSPRYTSAIPPRPIRAVSRYRPPSNTPGPTAVMLTWMSSLTVSSLSHPRLRHADAPARGARSFGQRRSAAHSKGGARA